MQTSVTLFSPVFSSLHMAVWEGRFPLFCSRQAFFPSLVRNAKGFGLFGDLVATVFGTRVAVFLRFVVLSVYM